MNISKSKVRTWINKYWDGQLGELYNTKYSWKVDGFKAIDFHTLTEFFILSYIAETGVLVGQIIKAHKELSLIRETPYPFATKTVLDGIRTDGKRLYFELLGKPSLSLDGKRQFNLDVVKHYFKNLDFDTNNMVSQIWPDGKNSSVVCNPKHKLGLPIIMGTNIQAEAIYSMHLAGESNKFIAELYELPLKNVKDAIHLFSRAA